MNLEIELPDFDDAIETNRGIKRYVQKFADVWFRTPVRIALTIGIVIACLGLIGWNLQRLAILDEHVGLEVVEFELEDELSDLKFKLSGIDMEALGADIERENDKVFLGFPELAAWAQGLSEIATQRGIEFSYRVEKAHLSPIPGILEVPVMLEFKAGSDSADTIFAQTMQLIGVVLNDHWHIDVISTYAEGDGQGLDSMRVRAQVWVRDLFGFVDLESLQPVGNAEEVEAETDMFSFE